MRQNLGVQRIAATSVTDMAFKADAFDLSRPAEVRTATDRCDDRPPNTAHSLLRSSTSARGWQTPARTMSLDRRDIDFFEWHFHFLVRAYTLYFISMAKLDCGSI